MFCMTSQTRSPRIPAPLPRQEPAVWGENGERETENTRPIRRLTDDVSRDMYSRPRRTGRGVPPIAETRKAADPRNLDPSVAIPRPRFPGFGSTVCIIHPCMHPASRLHPWLTTQAPKPPTMPPAPVGGSVRSLEFRCRGHSDGIDVRGEYTRVTT